MNIFSRKTLKLTLFLVLGLAYFNWVAGVATDINPIVKNYVVLIPLQLLALGYVAYFYGFGGKKKLKNY